MTADFDIHEHRHELKQLRDSGESKLFENRGDVECPVCRTVFRRIFLTTNSAVQFPENDGSRLCVQRQSETLAVFRH